MSVLRRAGTTSREAPARTTKPGITHCAFSRTRPGHLCPPLTEDSHGPRPSRVFEPEADALGEEQGCVDEADQSELPDAVRGKVGSLGEGVFDVAVAGIEAEPEDPVLEDFADVGVHEAEDSGRPR